VTDNDVQFVIEQEIALLSAKVRTSPARVDLLDPDYREIGASGPCGHAQRSSPPWQKSHPTIKLRSLPPK
jgi:hypothetical protein